MLIKQNGKYHVHVTAKDFDEVQTLKVAIRETEKPNDYIFELTRNITLVNGETQKIEFDVSIYGLMLSLKVEQHFF